MTGEWSSCSVAQWLSLLVNEEDINQSGDYAMTVARNRFRSYSSQARLNA